MSNKSSVIKIKNSSVPNKVPQVSDLVFGEIAINFNDGKLYFKNSSNQIDFFKSGSSVDGGFANSIYLQNQVIDGGSA